ncbi:hypothetical protein NOM01_15435 [Sporolactobacillus sp. STSJ-5]|uniref:hypothetical protein n=1 Tax=Sporolactobacillus sp. STSJ-5 TaxID=2965076 RepID=UPI0021041B5D|nr:hypothetical protein [Sporolactobacillus sp. STSJ-5]MCQ2011372.1 hypothetical protein [Sporolactobacillus sp. STSJ-5]
MAESIKTIVLSGQAQAVAKQMNDSGTFPDSLSAAKFGMAYAIKYYWDAVNTSDKLNHLNGVYDSKGSTYNIGSLDPDNYVLQLMEALYPDSDTPYTFTRVLICFGLNKLGDLLEEGRLFPINKVM